MEPRSDNVSLRGERKAFTLLELLVSIAVLSLLVVMVTQLVNSTAVVTVFSTKNMDANEQARVLLDRLNTDFTRMVRRGDVDYLLKVKQTTPQAGNDLLAFFSEVPGYSNGSPSPVSLVAYRINTNLQFERLGKGLLWNGASGAEAPMVFLPKTIALTWPAITNSAATDSNFETIGPQVFRFEYFYFLKNGVCSATPWDPTISTGINGLRDVAAIAVVIAVIDPRSRNLITQDQLNTLAGQMEDFAEGMKPGDLETQWQSKINASPLPRPVASSIRVYGRFFYLATTPQ